MFYELDDLLNEKREMNKKLQEKIAANQPLAEKCNALFAGFAKLINFMRKANLPVINGEMIVSAQEGKGFYFTLNKDELCLKKYPNGREIFRMAERGGTLYKYDFTGLFFKSGVQIFQTEPSQREESVSYHFKCISAADVCNDAGLPNPEIVFLIDSSRHLLQEMENAVKNCLQKDISSLKKKIDAKEENKPERRIREIIPDFTRKIRRMKPGTYDSEKNLGRYTRIDKVTWMQGDKEKYSAFLLTGEGIHPDFEVNLQGNFWFNEKSPIGTKRETVKETATIKDVIDFLEKQGIPYVKEHLQIIDGMPMLLAGGSKDMLIYPDLQFAWDERELQTEEEEEER